MRFYAETLGMAVVAGTVYAVAWWALDRLGFGNSTITIATLGFAYGCGFVVGVIVEHRRWMRALDEKIGELRRGEAA